MGQLVLDMRAATFERHFVDYGYFRLYTA